MATWFLGTLCGEGRRKRLTVGTPETTVFRDRQRKRSLGRKCGKRSQRRRGKLRECFFGQIKPDELILTTSVP